MKSFCKPILWVVSALVAASYLLACCTPYIGPQSFWIMGFLGLGFPVLLLSMFVLAIIWFFVRKKMALIFLLLAGVGYQNIRLLVAFNPVKDFAIAKAPGSIRIISWNVMGFDTHDKARDSVNSVRHKILNYIEQHDADILCLQDFTEYDNPQLPSNVSYLKDSLHFPYYYFADDYTAYPPWGPSYAGIAIFSKYPITHVERIRYPGKKTPESIIIADITIRNTKRRFIVTHLQSMHLRNLTVLERNNWDNNEDSAIAYSGSVYKKLRFYLPYHAEQSLLVKKQIEQSPYPVIFSADMNEVPASYAYHQVKGNLNDVFLMKGAGLGRTYYKISPTLRIDHILVSPSIKVEQYKKDAIFLSDHYPQVFDIAW